MWIWRVEGLVSLGLWGDKERDVGGIDCAVCIYKGFRGLGIGRLSTQIL